MEKSKVKKLKHIPHILNLGVVKTTLKIIKNNENFGAGISRNIGISQSVGEIIAFIDSDDYWFKEKLEKQLNFMNDNNLDFTFCNYEKKISEKKSITIISQKKNLIIMT